MRLFGGSDNINVAELMKSYSKTFMDKMEKTEKSSQGFIAMSISDNTKTISGFFKNAIGRCGYIPRRIDEKEHNNQIVPEVIICCCEDVLNSDDRPHFDIAQKSTIVWKDEGDLENSLYRRIEATVGLNK